MFLIVGLGNPGRKFQKTRHNLGFQAIDQFQRKNKAYFFSGFRLEKKFQAEILKGKINSKKIILAKPQTFMNNSGLAVKKIIKKLKIEKKCLVVVHDDIDLPLGKIRIVKNRGTAGHKGVESIIKELGIKNFARFRIGLQPKSGKPKNVEKFVLQKLNKEEEIAAKEAVEKTVRAIELFLKRGLEKTMTEYNK